MVGERGYHHNVPLRCATMMCDEEIVVPTMAEVVSDGRMSMSSPFFELKEYKMPAKGV